MVEDKKFKALWVEETQTDVFDMTIAERNTKDLPEGELLIEVEYSSLNFKDALSAHGNRGVTRKFPHTPGIDAAGKVIEDSSGTYQAGETVIVTGYDLGMNTSGGLAEVIRVPVSWAVPLPDGMTARESMIYGTAGLTAALCIGKILSAGATPNDGEVVVTGATGGVGTMAIAMLVKLGFKVAAVTGKLESNEMLINLGAQKIIDRASLDEIKSKPMVKPQWAHGIDCLGGDYLFTLLKSLHYGGSVAACGLASDSSLKGNVFPFILRNVNLLGVDSVELPLQEKQQAWGKLATDLKLDNLGSMASELGLAQVPSHLQQIYNGHARGRYLVNLKA